MRIVIIGSGITGTLTARELALAGHDVTLLEAAHIGAGSSSRTAAGIRQQFSTPGTVHGMQYSIRFYNAFRHETSDGVSPLIQNGYLFLYDAAGPWSAAQERVEMQHGAGLTEVEALDPDALGQRFGWVDAERCLGATWCPTDGFLLPDVIYGEAARRAVALGATLVQHAPVVGKQSSGGRLTGVQTAKGLFEADLFIDCTNAWTRRLAALLDAEPLPVDPLKRYLWFLKREGSMTAETLQGMPLTICPSGLYCRPENPESLLFGKRHDTGADNDFDYDDQDEIEPEFSHKTGIDSMPFEHWMELAEVLPPMAEFGGITASTSGYYGVTPDHNPFLGYDPRLSNLIRLVGFSGHGAMFGPFTARVARVLVEAGEDVPHVDLDGDEVPLDAFRIGRAYDSEEVMVI